MIELFYMNNKQLFERDALYMETNDITAEIKESVSEPEETAADMESEEAANEEAAPTEAEASEAIDDGDDFDDFDDFDIDPDNTEPEEASAVNDDEADTDAPEPEQEPDQGKKPSIFKRMGAAIAEKYNIYKNKFLELPWRRIGKIAAITTAVCAVTYFSGVLFYSSHFYFHTALGSFDCSNLSKERAEEKIRAELDNYEFIIRERNDKNEIIKGKNIDYRCKAVLGIEEAMGNQNPFKWFFDRDARIQPIEIKADFDLDKLYHEAEKLDCFAESIRDMDGAYAGVYYEDGSYRMREIENKNAISFERLYSSLVAGFKGAYKGMSLEEEGVYVLMADEDNMRHAIEKMNKYVSTVVTYTRGTETFELNGDTIQLWISINPDCSVELDEDGVWEYVNQLAGLYNTVGMDRSFTTSGGSVITVGGGDYGWEINKASEMEALIENIKNGEVITREPKTKRREIGDTTAITGTYVEVSIAAQTLWYYKNGELIISSPVVTGNPLKGNGTHTGVYSLKYKERDATLKGDDYETPVAFWMPFNGGEGLHDATWRGAFGGSIYRGGGSHGCVNLPYKVAATIFENISPGTPVVVF